MKTQIYERFESGLPADDDHPYRTGAWRPQQTEYDAWHLEVVRLAEGVYASETVMAPRVGSTAEDDGYLITFTMDMNEDRSECLILNAASPSDEPVARISLPERMSSGTHAFWQPDERPTN